MPPEPPSGCVDLVNRSSETLDPPLPYIIVKSIPQTHRRRQKRVIKYFILTYKDFKHIFHRDTSIVEMYRCYTRHHCLHLCNARCSKINLVRYGLIVQYNNGQHNNYSIVYYSYYTHQQCHQVRSKGNKKDRKCSCVPDPDFQTIQLSSTTNGRETYSRF
jgi:hypothetical protein